MTKHFMARMTQRGVTEDLVSLALQFGEPLDDGRVVIGTRALDQVMVELQALKRAAQKARERGGLVVVEEGGTLVTVYQVNGRHKRSKSIFRKDIQ